MQNETKYRTLQNYYSTMMLTRTLKILMKKLTLLHRSLASDNDPTLLSGIERIALEINSMTNLDENYHTVSSMSVFTKKRLSND